MKLKNNLWYFIAQMILILCSIIAFVFYYEIQKGIYMLNFIMLGFIVKRLIDIKKSNKYIIKKPPFLNALIVIVLVIAFFIFLLSGISINSYIFTISIISGLVGLFILVYISRYVQNL